MPSFDAAVLIGRFEPFHRGHLGLLRNWTPWVAASAPSVIYLLLSLGAFSWLVRYR